MQTTMDEFSINSPLRRCDVDQSIPRSNNTRRCFLVLNWSSFATFMWLNQTFPRKCQYSLLRMPALPFYGRYQRTGEKSQHGSWIDRQRRYNCEVNKNCFDSKMAWRTYYAKPVPLLKCYKMLFFRFETKIRIIVLICPKSRFSSKSFITLSTN